MPGVTHVLNMELGFRILVYTAAPSPSLAASAVISLSEVGGMIFGHRKYSFLKYPVIKNPYIYLTL